MEIKSTTGKSLFSDESQTVKEAFESAVLSGANLSGADLVGADLVGANLSGADLVGLVDEPDRGGGP